MTPSRILVVDDNDAIRDTLRMALQVNGFEVEAASGVKEALAIINRSVFDVLLCDLHMPGAGDGLTVVSAMRHSNPAAVTLIFSGFPALKEAVSAILLQADEILVKPMEMGVLVNLIRDKMSNRKPTAAMVTASVAEILERNIPSIIDAWYEGTQKDDDLANLAIGFKDRTFYLHRLLEDVILRLRLPPETKVPPSNAAREHGKYRGTQGYSAPMLVEESRVLQVSIFKILQENLSSVDFSLVLRDVMTIADEVDSQLKQMLQSFLENPEPRSALRVA